MSKSAWMSTEKNTLIKKNKNKKKPHTLHDCSKTSKVYSTGVHTLGNLYFTWACLTSKVQFIWLMWSLSTEPGCSIQVRRMKGYSIAGWLCRKTFSPKHYSRQVIIDQQFTQVPLSRSLHLSWLKYTAVCHKHSSQWSLYNVYKYFYPEVAHTGM